VVPFCREDFRSLRVWRAAHSYTLLFHRATAAFPIALGSACEALGLTLLAGDLNLFTTEQFTELESELAPVRRMLVRLIERTRSAKCR
jgi:hypothetical protein